MMFSCNFLLFRAAVAALAVVIALTGCTSGMGAGLESLKHLLGRGKSTGTTAPLDPKFAYLRVTRGNHVGLLWRGSMEKSPDGPIEVYYSGSGEVVRLRNGRLVGALGLTTEWRHVQDAAPAWSLLAKAEQPAAFVRIRDVMPGYRSGVRDELTLRVIAPPARSALAGLDPKSLTWFEESVRREDSGFGFARASANRLPPAKYAVDFSGEQPTVAYAEQCLAHDLCFTWQRWSAAMQHALVARSSVEGR